VTARPCLLAAAVVAALALLPAATPAPASDGPPAVGEAPPPPGVPFDNDDSRRLMQLEPTSPSLLRNGSFEEGRYWPSAWEPVDGLTTFWAAGGTDGERCLRVCTDVLEAQWQQRAREVHAAVAEAARASGGNPQALETNPVPPPPERVPTSPPYYDTVAGLHGVHYRSDYVECRPDAVYRVCTDARCETGCAPMVFVKGFFDQEVETEDGPRLVRRDAYRAPMTLDPCDGTWRRYARLFHPSRSQSTLDGEPLAATHLQVQLYAYWKPGDYFFDNVRLEIVGTETTPPGDATDADGPAVPEDTGQSQGSAGTDEDEFPVFDP
jgi:hypothetical protein